MKIGTIIDVIFLCSIIVGILGPMVWLYIKEHKQCEKLPDYEICKSYNAVNDKTKYVVWQYFRFGWKDENFSSDTFEEAEEVVKRIIENNNEINTSKIVRQYHEKHFSE